MFANREQAGQLLAGRLEKFKGRHAIVLAIPRGGVVVGKVVAQELAATLSVLIVRKIGAPYNEEVALGAVSTDGVPYWNEEVIDAVGADREFLSIAAQKKFDEVKQRMELFGVREKLEVGGKTVIVTDDGIATGSTVRAAISLLKQHKPKKIVLAIPVCPPETADALKLEADEVVVLETPPFFSAVGQFYSDFREVTDDEVRAILDQNGK